MQVKDEDISTLIELQHNDMELLRVQKAIADLPQRKTIVAARKKIKTIEEKQETVGKLRAKAEEKLAGISEEDGKLAAKQEEAQKAVDSASGYRDVEAHTREMDGYAKRRATLEEDLAAVDAELDKISAVEKQISTALAQLRETESAATAEFQSQGGELKKQEADLTSSHAQGPLRPCGKALRRSGSCPSSRRCLRRLSRPDRARPPDRPESACAAW